MKLTYFWSSDATRKPFQAKVNERMEAVPNLLKELRTKGCDVEFVDTAGMADRQRFEAYLRVSQPAVYKHYNVRNVLGTNRRSACWFGAEVPALIATYADSIGDAYPHRKGNRITTIYTFLSGLVERSTPQTN